MGIEFDILVENRIVIETKSVDALNDIHLAQVLTYLKLSNCKYGLLINFNVIRLVDGIRRLVNKYYIDKTSVFSVVKKDINHRGNREATEKNNIN